MVTHTKFELADMKDIHMTKTIITAGVIVTVLLLASAEIVQVAYEHHSKPAVEFVSSWPPASPLKGCEHLYDVGQHREWAGCMGVGFR